VKLWFKKKRLLKNMVQTIQGAWVDAPAHLFYLFIDAPNAHVINDLMADLKFFLWNNVDINRS
jgi:hypothetical protein